MRLSEEHIDFIVKDLHRRGIVVEGLEDELIDHVCSAVEERIEKGERFAEAYNDVIRSFGHTAGLINTQSQVLTETKPRNVMLRNYFQVAVRHLLKGRMYTAINVAGLAIGIASCLLIILYVRHELSYESWNNNADRIYRVDLEIKFGPNHFKLAENPAPVANTLQTDYPEIESNVRMMTQGSYLVRAANTDMNSREANVIWTDSTFFKLFPIRVLEGDPKTALRDARSLAISRTAAEKYFPGISAIGQMLTLDNKYTGKVTAVYEDIPKNTHFHFDILIAMVGDWPISKGALSEDFLTGEFNTYLLLNEGADAKALEAKLPQFVEKYMGKAMGVALGTEFKMDEFVKAGNKYEASLMPLKDIHLKSNKIGELEANGNVAYVYMFAAIGALILLIACVNFINLSTARSGSRAKEVGVRKVMGSVRSHLIRQFLIESMLVTVVSFALAVLTAWLVLPLFNELATIQLTIPFGAPGFYLALFASSLFIGLMAGAYPAFLISAFRPVSILKGNTTTSGKSFARSAMVVFQFAISVFLIVGTLTVNKQLSFIQGKQVGFDRSQVIIIKDGYALRPNPKVFKTQALNIGSIETGTMSGHTPVDNPDAYRNTNATWREGQDPSAENMVNLQFWGIDEDYIPTFKMNVIEGRNFSKAFPADGDNIILNKAAAALFNFEGSAVGKRISSFTGDDVTKEEIKTYTIVGIIEDFNFSSLKEAIKPVAFTLHDSDGAFSFRFEGNRAEETIQQLEALWKKIAPGQPFRYSFLDEEFGEIYVAEQRLAKIFTIFSTLAIAIACIGLFALTAFATQQRTREVGIRKVLGASVSEILLLLSKDFGKLILIAFVIAIPAAWYGVTWWLTDYAYKTDVGVSIYVLAGLIISAIAAFTMSFQSIRAALANPVKSLRNE